MSGIELELGKIITTPQKRDAIHIAVAPVVAGEDLSPGLNIGLDDAGLAIRAGVEESIGIVDPFLKQCHIAKGETFWLFLYPNTVTGMRHQWEHPAFNDQGVINKQYSEQWLRNYCDSENCPSYEELIKIASGQDVPHHYNKNRQAYENNGAYITIYGQDAYAEIPPEFWIHVEIVTGIQIPQNKRATAFSCSC